jgi:dienelactone hydrolase
VIEGGKGNRRELVGRSCAFRGFSSDADRIFEPQHVRDGAVDLPDGFAGVGALIGWCNGRLIAW